MGIADFLEGLDAKARNVEENMQLADAAVGGNIVEHPGNVTDPKKHDVLDVMGNEAHAIGQETFADGHKAHVVEGDGFGTRDRFVDADGYVLGDGTVVAPEDDPALDSPYREVGVEPAEAAGPGYLEMVDGPLL